MSALEVSVRAALPGFALDARWRSEGGIAVLFGRSGAGKSLTLRMIAGLARPDGGRIVSGGRVLFDAAAGTDLAPQRRSVGFVLQEPGLFPHMTVLENVRYGGHGLPADERRGRAAELLERFGLGTLAARRPAEISGGQRQRVALARALLRRPGVLLLDEPFSALDGPLRREMRRLLRELRRDHAIPILLVTHDRREAFELADALILYERGRVAAQGRVGEVVRTPLPPETRALLACRPPGPGGPRTPLRRRPGRRAAGPSHSPSAGWRHALPAAPGRDGGTLP